MFCIAASGWPFEDIEFDYPIQSPIDIISSDAVWAKLPILEFHRLNWKNVTVRVKNTGYTGSTMNTLAFKCKHVNSKESNFEYQF